MSEPSPAPYVSAVARQRRPRGGEGHRTNRVNLRLSDAELSELTAAAARTGETPAGYAARVALAVARGEVAGGGVDVGEFRELAYGLMQTRTVLGRVGGLLNQAVTVLHSTGHPPAYLADAVERCAAAIDRVDAATRIATRVLGRRRRHRPVEGVTAGPGRGYEPSDPGATRRGDR
jgi:hypothetical protein